MNDLDDLRHTLRQREALAPDPDAVLHSALRNARSRGARRKAVGAVAGTAVAATAGLVALGVTSSTPGQQDVQVASPPASPPSSTASAPAWETRAAQVKVPFTVGYVPAGYHADAWRVSASDSSQQYVGNADFATIVVRLRTTDPAVDASATVQPVTVGGTAGSLRALSPGGEHELSWPIAPGLWASVLGSPQQVSDTTLMQVAESVTLTPAATSTTLHSLTLPADLNVQEWTSGDAASGESGMLCPIDSASQPAGSARIDQAGGRGCVSLSVHAGTAPAATTTVAKVPPAATAAVGQPTVTTQRIPLDHTRTVDGVAVRTSADGHTVVRQLDDGHWLLVTSPDVDPATLTRIAADAR